MDNKTQCSREVTESLIRAATEQKEKAYAPYSGFHVGAAVLSEDGRIFSGCNVENASYGLSICAERTAVFRAAGEGVRVIRAIAVTGDARVTWPCGACRQVLSEFVPAGQDMDVILAASLTDYRVFKLSALLPGAFRLSGGDKENLKGSADDKGK